MESGENFLKCYNNNNNKKRPQKITLFVTLFLVALMVCERTGVV